MSETPPLTLPTPQPPNALTPAKGQTLSLPVTLTQATGSLDIIPRPISLTGTLTNILQDGTMQLRTSMGTVTMQALDPMALLQNNLQTLLSKPAQLAPLLTLVIQPGAFPKGGQLFITLSGKTQNTTPEDKNAPPQTAMMKTPATPRADQAKPPALTIKATVMPSAASQAPTAEAPHTPAPSSATELFFKNAAAEEKTTPAPPKLNAGQTITLKIINTKDEAAQPTQHQQNPIIRATITGKSPAGQTLLESNGQSFLVHEQLNLPSGAKLVAEIIPTLHDAAPEKERPRQTQSADPIIDKLTTFITAQQPENAQSLQRTQLPNTDHRLGPTLMFFLNALGQGQVEEWLTAKTALPEKEPKLKTDLVQSLQDTLNDTHTDHKVGEWKCYPIPLRTPEGFERIPLYVHKDTAHAPHTTTTKTTKTRFLLTLSLSHLGSMQLDGLSQNRKLDLIIRSELGLPQALETDLRETTTLMLEALGLTGSLIVQKGRDHWVTMNPRPSHRPDFVT